MKISTLDLEFLHHSDTIAAFLIEHEHGLDLVESGPDSTFPMLCKAIEQAGYDWHDVQRVFLTHIHFDHAGAAWRFAENGAKIYVHPFGAKHLINPEKLVNSAKMIYQDDFDRLWGEVRPIAAEQVIEVHHGDTFPCGQFKLIGWHTPGHAVHHIAWQIGDYLFCGDVAGIKVKGGPVVPPCPPPDINIEDWKNSIALIRSCDPKELILTHFGAVNAIDEHFEALEQVLDSWAEFIHPFVLENTPEAEVVPQFVEFVNNGFREKGLDEESIAKYNSANPPFMSVAGLMRYWRKKLAN